MTGSTDLGDRGKLAETSAIGADGYGGSGSAPPPAVAAAESEDHVSEMMGRLRLTAVEAATVVLDDGAEGFPIHSRWALVGKVLAPSTLHISTIRAALRPAWGNPRGHSLNPAGDNMFIAEFGTKADKDRVADDPPWVVGRHVVILQDFDVDRRPKNMVFNNLKIWVRIFDLPFGYMHKRWDLPLRVP
jgi:hypothetical protein